MIRDLEGHRARKGGTFHDRLYLLFKSLDILLLSL